MCEQKGFTLIELMIVIAIIAIIAAIAIPSLINARMTANESAAQANLKTISSAQALFREGDKDGDGVLDYATNLAELGAAGLIDDVISAGIRQGYLFTVSGSTYTWIASADPEVPGRSGNRYFFIDEGGVIRFNATTPAGPSDPPTGG